MSLAAPAVLRNVDEEIPILDLAPYLAGQPGALERLLVALPGARVVRPSHEDYAAYLGANLVLLGAMQADSGISLKELKVDGGGGATADFALVSADDPLGCATPASASSSRKYCSR